MSAAPRRWRGAWLLPLAWAVGCGGPQELGRAGAKCFRDDDCVAGLICVKPEGKNARVCSSDPTPIVSMVEGPPPLATGGTDGAAGTANGGEATGGSGNGAGSSSGGSAGTSAAGGRGGNPTNGGSPAGGTGSGTGGTDPGTAGTDSGTAGTDPGTGGTDPGTGGTDSGTAGTDPGGTAGSSAEGGAPP